MQIVNRGNNMYSQNSQMRSAISAHSPLGRITHLEKELSLSPDRMCAVLPAKWIKISVVLRSVICIWADPTQKDHPEKPLSRRQQVCSRFRATARVVPRLSHQTLDTLTKKSKTEKKMKWIHQDRDQSTLRANWQLPTFINRSQQGVEWHSSAKSWQRRYRYISKPGAYSDPDSNSDWSCSTCGPTKRPQSTRNQALNGLSVGPKKGRTMIILPQLSISINIRISSSSSSRIPRSPRQLQPLNLTQNKIKCHSS